MVIVVSLLLMFVVLILFYVCRLAGDVQVIRRELLADIRATLLKGPLCRIASAPPAPGYSMTHLPHDSATSSLGFFVIWQWRGGQWRLNSAPEGIEPGLSPSYPGAFDGDYAKTWVSEIRQ